uniref:cDNA FLJ59130, moderately similar to Homo sapiens WD repeat domain 1 (WDR1), transcript variant 2, mRNA n=1 Tax=Homo sapiens TaxID=9606 RepID=B4DZX5_HUMAN|nr:unnamed protein product [Homo sapiens]
MPYEIKKVFASLPQVERGVSKIIGGDPKGNNFLYTNGKCVILRNIDDHSRFVNCVRFSPDGNRFATASADGAFLAVCDASKVVTVFSVADGYSENNVFMDTMQKSSAWPGPQTMNTLPPWSAHFPWAPRFWTSSWAAYGRRTTCSVSPCPGTSTIWTETTPASPCTSSRVTVNRSSV